MRQHINAMEYYSAVKMNETLVCFNTNTDVYNTKTTLSKKASCKIIYGDNIYIVSKHAKQYHIA